MEDANVLGIVLRLEILIYVRGLNRGYMLEGIRMGKINEFVKKLVQEYLDGSTDNVVEQIVKFVEGEFPDLDKEDKLIIVYGIYQLFKDGVMAKEEFELFNLWYGDEQ